MAEPTPIDRLSSLLERFRVRAHPSGAVVRSGIREFDAREGLGFLHVLRSGSMEVEHPGEAVLPRRLRIAEPTVLFYPRAAAHRFRISGEGGELNCALLEFDGGIRNPLARALPPLVVLSLARVEGLAPALTLLFDETERVRCGQRLLAERLFEVVLIQLLRWLLDHGAEVGVQPGLIAGLSDPRLARALVAIHEAPGARWSVDRMARCAGMSRTAFAVAFRRVVGQTPADYLADWRITIAQSRLRSGRPLEPLAGELGYANASGLSRAFAARIGRSPRDWLRSVEGGVS